VRCFGCSAWGDWGRRDIETWISLTFQDQWLDESLRIYTTALSPRTVDLDAKWALSLSRIKTFLKATARTGSPLC